MRTYRVSALAAAVLRMWRAWSVVLPVVIVNAALQGALVAWISAAEAGWVLALALAISAGVFVLSYGLLASAALRVPEGRVGPSAAWQGLRLRLVPFLTWALVLLVVVSAGLAVHLLLALLVVGLTAFVLFAVLEARPRPLLVNLQTIGRRFWQWLLTGVVVVLVILVGMLLMGVTQFFLRDFLGAVVAWLGGGLVIAWFIVTRALIYRSAWAVDPEEGDGDEADVAVTPDLA